LAVASVPKKGYRKGTEANWERWKKLVKKTRRKSKTVTERMRKRLTLGVRRGELRTGGFRLLKDWVAARPETNGWGTKGREQAWYHTG